MSTENLRDLLYQKASNEQEAYYAELKKNDTGTNY